jgi:hypothetical protein
MTEDEKVANRVANDLVTRANGFADRNQPIGVAVVVTHDSRAAQLHAATQARWKTMLSAYSSGIAHAEQDIDTEPAMTTLRQLERLEIVAVGATASPSAKSYVLFVVDPSGLPPKVAVAYASMALDDAWRSAVAGADLVDVAGQEQS